MILSKVTTTELETSKALSRRIQASAQMGVSALVTLGCWHDQTQHQYVQALANLFDTSIANRCQSIRLRRTA